MGLVVFERSSAVGSSRGRFGGCSEVMRRGIELFVVCLLLLKEKWLSSQRRFRVVVNFFLLGEILLDVEALLSFVEQYESISSRAKG